MRIAAAGGSDCGRVREQNEDHFCIQDHVGQEQQFALACDAADQAACQRGLLLAVADGMGGYAGGALASRTALEALAQVFYTAPLAQGAGSLERHLGYCIEQARTAVALHLAADPKLAQAGTTLAGVVLAPPDELYVFHAGDSRVLRFAGGAHGFLRQLTVDHTPLGHALFHGELDEAAAALHPQNGQLTRSLGLVGNTQVQLECGLNWAVGDIFLLCSDGCHGAGRGLPRAQLQDVLRHGGSAQELVAQLLPLAVAQDGSDNATLVIAAVLDETVTEAEGQRAE